MFALALAKDASIAARTSSSVELWAAAGDGTRATSSPTIRAMIGIVWTRILSKPLCITSSYLGAASCGCNWDWPEYSVLKYKGYSGKVEFDDEAEMFHGGVCGLKDVITFQARSARKLKKAFCEKQGQQPDRPFSGRMIVRVPPDLHRDLHNVAAAQQVSLNALNIKLLEKRIGLEC